MHRRHAGFIPARIGVIPASHRRRRRHTGFITTCIGVIRATHRRAPFELKLAAAPPRAHVHRGHSHNALTAVYFQRGVVLVVFLVVLVVVVVVVVVIFLVVVV